MLVSSVSGNQELSGRHHWLCAQAGVATPQRIVLVGKPQETQVY
jgi:hypothetical protein